MSEQHLYKLRTTLMGHSMDVRMVTTGVSEEGKEFIVSASRDRSSKIWFPSPDGSYSLFQSCEGHTSYVSCATVLRPIPASPNNPIPGKELILTGGHDHTILAFEIGKEAPVFRLIGHKGTVCSIAASNLDGTIVSGSWDMTAKVWRGQECISTLSGHTAAVWAVALLPNSMGIITGSADREIRLWTMDGQTKKTFKGHTDCVRALAIVDENRFLSGSNDATIRVWDLNQGETIHTFYGHTNFIYSIAILPNKSGFASVGEDRTLRVWDNGAGECKQVIYLPATSVWSVACTEDNDIVTGSSDGVVRVFTADPTRYADLALIEQFEKEVSQSTIAAQQELGGMKVSELPGPEALLKPGRADGDTKMVREGAGGQVACYSWSAAESKWNKIGDVVGASGATQSTSGRVLYEGKEYDYVFSVELDDKSSCKLPYNITEDPWFAAQKFIEKNNLSQLYLDQVANFIVSNTKGMTLGSGGSGSGTGYVDPFTGGNRYVPGAIGSSTSNGVGGGGVDPLTGSGAYRTSAASGMNTDNPAIPLEDRIRTKLNAEGVKLWIPPYFEETTGVNDGSMMELSHRYCQELKLQDEVELVEILLGLQRNALDKLAERDLFKNTGIATLKVQFTGIELPGRSSGGSALSTKKIQIKLKEQTGKDLKGKISELIHVDENSIKVTSSNGTLIQDGVVLEAQGIKNSGQVNVTSV